MEKTTEYSNIYNFRLQNINDTKVNCDIYLYIKKNIKIDLNDDIICNLKLELPFEAKNEGCFNNKLYLFSNNIYGYGYVEDIIYRKRNGSYILNFFNNLKKEAISSITNKFSKNESGILISMIFSNKDYLTKDIKNIFSTSNLSHILVVSGTHLSYILAFTSFFINNLSKKKKKIFFLIIIAFYLFITNFSISVLRSFLVYFISLIYIVCNKRKNNIDTFLITLLIFLVYNPLMLFNASIILSFLSVININLIYKRINMRLQYNFNNKNNKKIYKILELFSLTICVYIAIMPVISIYFNRIYIMSVFSNIFAVPLSGYIIIVSFIYLFTYKISIFSSILISILKVILNILIVIAKLFSFIPFSNVLIFPFNFFELFIYYFVIFTIYINNELYYFLKKKILNILKKINYKVKIIAIIIILIVIVILMNIDKEMLKINFIDVGQGDSTLIRVNNIKILIDGGGSKNDFDVGEKTLMPYLLNKRIFKIDYIIITHFDIDHCGGLIYIINNFNVKNIIIAQSVVKSDEYYNFFNNIVNTKINIIKVKKNDIINLGKNTRLEVLGPLDNINSIENIENNSSILCKLYYYDFSCLFTGDIEKQMEEKVVKTYGGRLKSDVLKIGHHGSKNSTTDDFLKEVSPKISLIGVGKNNYGHPNNEVIERLNSKDIKIYRTDINGEIKIKKYKKNNISIKTAI